MVAAEIVRERFRARYRFVKEATTGQAVDDAGMSADCTDSTGERVHDDQSPVGLDRHGSL